MSKWLSLLLLSLITTIAFLPDQIHSYQHAQNPCRPLNSYPFCNSSLPISTRAQFLISLLTIDEKIQQLCNGAAAIPRLSIPAYEWWSESLHGIAINGPGVYFNGSITSATIFPQVLLTSASFNQSLWFLVAKAIGVEARAMYNVGQAGLTFWAPNINIFRDPRWGRGQETPGEDPVIVSAYAVEYVRGFQGEYGAGDEVKGKRVLEVSETGGDSDLMLSACCKHFTAYDLENWGNFTRYTFNAKVTLQDLEDTYQPPFKSCIQEGRASCLMCSYNQINGVPACARHDLLQKARTEWGFNGYITSDCDAVAIIYEDQRYAHSPEDAVADVLKAGMDINCGTYLLRNTKSAFEQGKIKETDIDRALFNLFSVQLRLGIFDEEPTKRRFGKFGPRDVCSTKHRKLALEAAKQGIVLLKNDKKLLPLDKNIISSVAIIGPAANNATLLGGDYTGIPCNPKSLYEVFRGYIQKASYATGCFDISCYTSDGFSEAVHVAKQAEVVVVICGLDLSQETEDHDRVSLLLPGKQMDLISTVASSSKRPLILLLMGGGPIDVSFAKEDPRISSILWIGYPGETGGQAIVEVIFGDFNPGGRLPVTWYPESFMNVPMNDMNMRPDPSKNYPGRTYRFYTGEVVYGFGYGLSYSCYSYKFLSMPEKISLLSPHVESDPRKKSLYERKDELNRIYVADIASCEALTFRVSISVMNNGDMDGSHVTLLFSSAASKSINAPQKQLIGFKRVHTQAYKATEMEFTVNPCKHLSSVDENGKRILLLGDHILMVEEIEHSVCIEI